MSHTFIDLFAGLGGFRLGLEAAGHVCVFGSDKDKHAARIYKENFGEDIYSDVSSIDPATLPDFDILCGGFPCQPFSKAGFGEGFEDARGTLFFDICRIISEKKPSVVILENVKNLASHDKGNTMTVIVESLENLGYAVSYSLLQATDFGVAQSRQRIIIIAARNGVEFDFSTLPVATTKPIIRDFLEEEHDEMEWLDPEDYEIIDDELIKTQPATGLRFVGYKKGNLRQAGVRPGTQHLSRVHKQSHRIYSELGVHPTISSQESSGRFFIQVERADRTMGVRKLTMLECFRLFGYPDEYKKVGSPSEQYRRIGNSICVPMVEAIAEEITVQILGPSVNL